MSARKAAAPAGSRTAGTDTHRALTDPREIRALAHPVRLALLEALLREGPLTATEASEILDESPANCSFHFRTLQKYGFVEEAPGGSGRNRPWRRTTLGESIRANNDASELAVATQGLAEMSARRVADKFSHYLSTNSSHPKAWQRSDFLTTSVVYLTPKELDEIGRQMSDLLDRYRERSVDKTKRPQGAAAVQVASLGFPLPPSPSGN